MILVVAGASARADVLLTVDAPVLDPFGAYEYGGTIRNTGASEVTIYGTSITLPATIGYTDIFGDIVLGDLPLTLSAGGYYSTNDFFELVVGNFDGGTGTFSLNDGESLLASAAFSIPVPEPASMALLGMAVAGAVGAQRRRPA